MDCNHYHQMNFNTEPNFQTDMKKTGSLINEVLNTTEDSFPQHFIIDGQAVNDHLPDSQARCSRGLRPSLAESVF